MAMSAASRWSTVLEEAERSELSMRAFARSRGINPNTMAWWKWKPGREVAITEEATSSSFVEVCLQPPTRRILIRFADWSVEVDEHTDLDLLRLIVDAIG